MKERTGRPRVEQIGEDALVVHSAQTERLISGIGGNERFPVAQGAVSQVKQVAGPGKLDHAKEEVGRADYRCQAESHHHGMANEPGGEAESCGQCGIPPLCYAPGEDIDVIGPGARVRSMDAVRNRKIFVM